MSAEQVTIDRSVLQMVFDAAVHSMDFVSGFLDGETVVALRAIAVLLGVDPMIATPPEFKCKYSGKHEGWPGEYKNPRCKWCKQVLP